MARRLKIGLQVPITCVLQGEDSFLDSLPEPQRKATWETLTERARDVDLFIAPSRYFGDLMQDRLKIPPERMRIVYNGINLAGYTQATIPPHPPVLGYFSRMSRVKGLDLLVESFLLLKRRDRTKNLRLRVGGGMGPSDEPFVESLRQRLRSQGCLADVEFCPNLDRPAKQSFLRSLTVMSAPALYGEAFGLYVIEAMASGVPVVQPRHASFPELIEATGGGLLCEPNASALADGIEELLSQPERAQALGEAGRQAVLRRFSVERMARDIVEVFLEIQQRSNRLSTINSQPS
jgi:glycosyltransferase involved in cell wall biosynthesis